MTGQHKEITPSFMIPGHTKFSPDWCFGLLKKKYRRTKVGGLMDLVGVVNESASVNVAQPTGQEDGSSLVTTYDWQEYFKDVCTKVTGIKKLHHLQFNSAYLGAKRWCSYRRGYCARAPMTRYQKVLGSNPGWILRYFLHPLTSLLSCLF